MIMASNFSKRHAKECHRKYRKYGSVQLEFESFPLHSFVERSRLFVNIVRILSHVTDVRFEADIKFESAFMLAPFKQE